MCVTLMGNIYYYYYLANKGGDLVIYHCIRIIHRQYLTYTTAHKTRLYCVRVDKQRLNKIFGRFAPVYAAVAYTVNLH